MARGQRARGLVRVAEAARRIGARPQWLRRYLVRRQELTGMRVLVASGRGRSRPTYLVDLRAARIACPELFAADADKLVAKGLEPMRRELREQREQLADLSANVAALVEAVRRLQARLAPGRA